MWLGQMAWDSVGGKGLREAEKFSDKAAKGRRSHGNFQAQQRGPPLGGHREKRPLGKGGTGPCRLTELERWATALMCSSSSKMRSSSSSVRCPGLWAWEGREARAELRAEARARAPSPIKHRSGVSWCLGKDCYQ